MLNFENNTEVSVKASNGVVILPAEEYKRMLLAIVEKECLLNCLVSVRQNPYDANSVEVNVDQEAIYTLAEQALRKTFTEDELHNYTVAKLGDFWVSTAYIASKKPAEDVQMGDAEIKAEANYDDINRPIDEA